MPENTRAKDFDWRLNLKVGDEIDAEDSSLVWYKATVLGFEKNRGITEEITNPHHNTYSVQVAYRIYRDQGENEDEVGNKFIGWGSTFDEWINVMSPRIYQFGKVA